jgi:hypothetical protein
MRRTFGLGAEGLGAVDAAQGVGMTLGGAVLSLIAARFRKKDLAGWSIILIGAMIALMGLASAFSLGDLIPSLAVEEAIKSTSAGLRAMTVGQRLLHLPLQLLLYAIILGVALVPAQSALMTMMQLAIPDLKRGRVGSGLNALTTAAGLISMAIAAAVAEVVALRMVYVVAGLIVAGGGVVGLLVLQEPESQAEETELGTVVKMAKAAAE